MSALTPNSLSYKSAEKPQAASVTFHTPAFFKEADYDDVPTRKKVLFTPKVGETKRDSSVSYRGSLSTQASTSCSSSTTCSVKTTCRGETDTHPARDIKKSLSGVLNMSSVTTNKKQPRKSEEHVQRAPKYGKRKIEYLDEDDEEDEELNQKENVRKNVKQVKLNVPTQPVISKLYLYNSGKSKMFCFPVFQESELKYNVTVQQTLRDTEIDNDCETENEILEYSIYQAKKDLAKGIMLQREEEAKLKKAATVEIRHIQFVDTEKKQRNKSEEKKNKEKQNDFWTNVRESFRELIEGASRKSL